MQQHHSWHGSKPTSLAGYLEAMSRAIFIAGMSWQVVATKWEGIKEAFGGFGPKKIAALSPDDVDRLAHDPRMIRNHKKIEAIVDNAARMLELDKQAGGFDKYLASLGDFDAKAEDITHNFRFMGPSTRTIFLALIGEKVPESYSWWGHRGHPPGGREQRERETAGARR